MGFGPKKIASRERVCDDVTIVQIVPRHRFQVVVLTISDRCSRGEVIDTAGPTVTQRLQEATDVYVCATEILPDDAPAIIERLQHYSGGHSIDLILTTGGTGFSPRDVTPEATRTVVERLTPGLDEATRAASLAKTPRAMLSRACSGIRASTRIVNLPGSQREAQENLDAILPTRPHALATLRGDTIDCGRVQEANPFHV